MMKLNDFLKNRSITMAAFADRVGTTTATISRVADGTVMPRKGLIIRIHQETDGHVTANDLAGVYCILPCPAVAANLADRMEGDIGGQVLGQTAPTSKESE